MKAATQVVTDGDAAAKFQSTPPVKAATAAEKSFLAMMAISIHAAREGGDPVMIALYNDVFISIHAAREGGDRRGLNGRIIKNISIHAAREGGDVFGGFENSDRRYFNPRRP